MRYDCIAVSAIGRIEKHNIQNKVRVTTLSNSVPNAYSSSKYKYLFFFTVRVLGSFFSKQRNLLDLVFFALKRTRDSLCWWKNFPPNFCQGQSRKKIRMKAQNN